MPLKIRKRLQPGDWVELIYGISRKECYVTDIGYDSVELALATQPTFTFGSSNDEVYGRRKGRYIGKGKLRWWWRFLPWRNSIAKYSRPTDN